MKRYATLLFISALSLTSQIARADIVDDAIGNIQRAINDAYHPSDSRDDDDRQYDDDRRRSDEQSDQERRQLDDEERRLEDEF